MRYKILYLFFQAYKKMISPYLPVACRFFPTCSEYAYIASCRHGLWKGAWLTLKRLTKCHPWGPAGFDYPPDPLKKR